MPRIRHRHLHIYSPHENAIVLWSLVVSFGLGRIYESRYSAVNALGSGQILQKSIRKRFGTADSLNRSLAILSKPPLESTLGKHLSEPAFSWCGSAVVRLQRKLTTTEGYNLDSSTQCWHGIYALSHKPSRRYHLALYAACVLLYLSSWSAGLSTIGMFQLDSIEDELDS